MQENKEDEDGFTTHKIDGYTWAIKGFEAFNENKSATIKVPESLLLRILDELKANQEEYHLPHTQEMIDELETILNTER